jgi:Ca-activated chloride channel family protein
MAGRHRPAKPADRTQRGRLDRQGDGRLARTRVTVFAVVLLVVITGTAATVAKRAGPPRCLGSDTKLDVVASPDVAPALRQVEERFERGSLGPNGRCVNVVVTARESADMVGQLNAALAADRPTAPASATSAATSGAPGQASPTSSPPPPGTLPDVWVPESSMWLARVHARNLAGTVQKAASIAHSPAVIAMQRPAADRLQWPYTAVSWKALTTTSPGRPPLRFQVADPTRSAASLAAMVALREATVGRSGDTTVVGALHAFTEGAAPTDARLLDELPRTAADAANPAKSGPQAFPYTEQGVWRYNATHPAVPLAAVYLTDGSATLDYPYAPLVPEIVGGAKRRAARDFLRAIQDPGGQQILQDHAFRTVTDAAGQVASPVNGLNWQVPQNSFVPPPTSADRVVRLWTVLKQPTRVLTLVDVSGSMLKVDPSARLSRIALTRRATGQGFGLVAGDWDVGLWIFSTHLTPTTDYKDLLDYGPPNAPVGDATHGQVLARLLASLTAKKGGATGLYDTTLAAYQKATRAYDPAKHNVVVLFTDGKNEDDQSITLPQLLAGLHSLYDPVRPIPIIILGFGNDIDESVLRTISDATHGSTYVSTSPSAVFQAFFEGMAQNACAPTGC